MRYAFFILHFYCLKPHAQPTIQWQKCLGGTGSDALYSVIQVEDQSYILTGHTFSGNGDVTIQKGNGDIWVLKLDTAGALLWQKSFGGSSTDLSASIALASNGGYIIAGSSVSNDIDVSGNHGDVDFWVLKLSDQGTLEWQKSLGGSKAEYCQAVAATQDGGYIFAGYSDSNDGNVSGNHGQSDVWVVKLNSAGIIEWQKCLGGSGSDKAYSIVESTDGSFTIAAETDSKDGDITYNFGNVDYWVIHLDHFGNILWQKTFGGTGLDKTSQIVQIENGNYLITGTSGSVNTGQVSGSHGFLDFWVVEVDQNGELIWQKVLGGSESDWGRSITIASNGEIVVAGTTISTDGDVLDNDGGADMWVVSFNESGDIQWQKTIGGLQAEELYAIYNVEDGGFIVSGKTWSNDGDVSGNHGTFDAWVVKLSPQSTKTHLPQPTQLTLYPNPAIQSITLQLPDNEPITSIQITDLSGKTLKYMSPSGDNTLPVAELPKGMYLLKARSASGTVFCGKFIRE